MPKEAIVAVPYILAKSFEDAHGFARGELGVERGSYRVVTSPSAISAVRGADLHLVKGWEKRADRFAFATALKYTRLNVIDHTDDEPVAAAEVQQPVPQPDGLFPNGYQQMLFAVDEASAFFDSAPPADNQAATEQVADRTAIMQEMSDEIGRLEQDAAPAKETPEPVKPVKNRRRSRCKECGVLHFKEDGCPTDDGAQ